ncbi:MAG: phosphotransferase [Candidatus Krumholzibacteriia bacterium]
MAEGRGFVLAAGHGRRLLPLTRHLPKALLPWRSRADAPVRTLLDAALEQVSEALAAAGGGDTPPLALNAHHLDDQIVAHAAAHWPRASVFREKTLLGTGGALDHARGWLAGGPWFLLRNADVAEARPLSSLVATHRAAGVLVTLRLVDWPAVNSVLVDGDGRVQDIAGRLGTAAGPGWRRLTYAGIAVCDRTLLDLVPAGVSSLVDTLERALRERPGSVAAELPPPPVAGPELQAEWADLGTVGRYLDALGRRSGNASGWVVRSPGSEVAQGARLRSCVVLPATRVAADAEHERAVLGPSWVVTEEENRVLGDPGVQAAGFGEGAVARPLADHGSERRFFRVTRGERCAVAMLTRPGDPDRDRTVAVARFLSDHELGGPDVLAEAPEPGPVLLEDLGETSLRELWERDAAAAEAVYRRTIDILVALQVRGAALAAGHCPLAGDRLLGHATLRWETRYFGERFLVGHAGFEPADLEPLAGELAALSRSVAAQPRVLVHRDLQAENVVIGRDGRPGLVDVQGMRRGPLGYDVASLLYDPYVALAPSRREDLLDRWRQGLLAAAAALPVAALAGTPERAQRAVVAAGLQRLMQALGAYGFLAHVRGRRRFLAFIPRGLAHLQTLLGEAEALRGVPGAAADPLLPPPLFEVRRVIDRLRTDAEGGAGDMRR